MPRTKNKLRSKITFIETSSDSDSDSSSHELSYYSKDKVRLMKEVLKIIKPKKIKLMAPDCIKHLEISEINALLFEELLGISSKRLQYIIKGEHVSRDMSSSESEEDLPPKDIILLDDTSEDDVLSISESESLKQAVKKDRKHKSVVAVKPEKHKKRKLNKSEDSTKNNEYLQGVENSKISNVLELVELQARARAIRSQLAMEAKMKKDSNKNYKDTEKKNEESDSDAIIIENAQLREIVITSESEEETEVKICKSKTSEQLQSQNKQISNVSTEATNSSEIHKSDQLQDNKEKLLKPSKNKLIHTKVTIQNNQVVNVDAIGSTEQSASTNNIIKQSSTGATKVINSDNKINKNVHTDCKNELMYCDNDEIVINLDEEEMVSMEMIHGNNNK